MTPPTSLDDAACRIRLATSEDAGTLARLQIAFAEEFDTSEAPLPVLERRFGVLLESPAAFALLAGADVAAPLGYAVVTLRPTVYCDGQLAVLDELYVQPSSRDLGVGTVLLDAAIAEVRARDGGEMHINVDEPDVDARRFYERHGFVNIEPGADGRMLCYVRPLDERGD